MHLSLCMYTNIILFITSELEALAEVIGPYGIQNLGERLMEQVSGQVKEIRKLVELNQDTLLALHTNRDKPDVFNDLMKRVKSKWQKHMLLYIHVHV